jgi:hypothetical protein
MGYLEYIVGKPVSFIIAERTSPQQVAERLKAEVRSRLWPFHFEKVVGRVGGETLSIEWRGGTFGSNMSPRLTGRLVSAAGKARFDGRFGAPVFLRFLLVLWVCFDLMFAIAMFGGAIQQENGAPWFVFPFLLVHLLAPFGITAIGMVGADRIQERLTDFVIEVGSGGATKQQGWPGGRPA